MEITCRIDFPDASAATEYRYVIGAPSPVEVVGQRMHVLSIQRSDGLQLKAYGFDLIDVYESALLVISCSVEGAAGRVGAITWD